MNPKQVAQASRLRRLAQRADQYAAHGQWQAAAASLQELLGIQPDHLPSMLQLAELQLRSGDYTQSRALTMQAITLPLESPQLAVRLICQLVAIGETSTVLDIIGQLPPPMWDSAHSLAVIAQQLSLVGAHNSARRFAHAAVERDPGHPPSLHMAATLELYFGETERSVDLLERCIARAPDIVDAHWVLSRLRQPDPAPRIERIERGLERVRPGDDEALLAYALHNELHEAGDYPRAWQALERACRAKRSVLPYDREATHALFDALHGWTADELARTDGDDSDGLRPVFVVGMHRSGTTLVERLLGGHSRITAAGETQEFGTRLRQATGRNFRGPIDLSAVQARHGFDYRQIGAEYRKAMAWRARERPLVTDKLPSNFLNIGFIARALPGARIIHVVRDPVHTGLSNLRTLFSSVCTYSYDQHDFVDYFERYQRLMAHWHALLPGRILDVQYADVIDDPAAQARRMAEFCGLDFEPDMLAIERGTAAVATASSVLVRDGIRADRSRLWTHYEAQLQPMLQAFGRAGAAA